MTRPEVPAELLAVDPRPECWRWSDADHQWLFEEPAVEPITLPVTSADQLREGSPVWMDPSAWDEREAATIERRVVVSIAGALATLAYPDGRPDGTCHAQYLTPRLDVTQ